MKKSHPDDHVPVLDPLRGLLCDVAYGWSPSPLPLGRISQVRYKGIDLSECAQELDLRGHRLRVTFTKPRREAGVSGMDGAIDGVLAAGPRFTGDTMLRVSESNHLSMEQGLRRSVEMEFARWTVLEGNAPSIWIGQVEGMGDLPLGGNLVVERSKMSEAICGRACHFRLSGAYTYYVVQRGRRDNVAWHMVVDTAGAGVPVLQELERDFLVLQFVLGRQMRMPILWGVEGRRTVGATLGCAIRRSLEEESVPPVPIAKNNDDWIHESWASVLFERISAAWRKRAETDSSYWVALDMYLDAMTNYLDGDYMRLQIALESFGYWLLHARAGQEPMDVRDKAAWEEWVREHGAAIRSHAREGREDALVQRVRDTYRLASGRVVPNAFSLHGIALTKEMKDELRGRDTAVHLGLMSPDGYDGDRDGRRVALVRTMLVALIAVEAGYRGAINGWELDRLGDPIRPDEWWTISDEDRRAAVQVHEAVEMTAGMAQNPSTAPSATEEEGADSRDASPSSRE